MRRSAFRQSWMNNVFGLKTFDCVGKPHNTLLYTYRTISRRTAEVHLVSCVRQYLSLCYSRIFVVRATVRIDRSIILVCHAAEAAQQPRLRRNNSNSRTAPTAQQPQQQHSSGSCRKPLQLQHILGLQIYNNTALPKYTQPCIRRNTIINLL